MGLSFLTYLVIEKCEPHKMATTGYYHFVQGWINTLAPFVTIKLGYFNVMWVYKSLDTNK